MKLKVSRKFREITKNENFAATLLLHNLLSATHPPLLSARRFFNAVRQCYFEMKPNKEPCFSILSIIILWYRRSMGVSDPHKFSCGSGSRITKMSIWIRIQGGKHWRRIITHKFFLNLIFQNDIKKSLKINKQTTNLSITGTGTKGILLLFLQICFHLMNLYIS